MEIGVWGWDVLQVGLERRRRLTILVAEPKVARATRPAKRDLENMLIDLVVGGDWLMGWFAGDEDGRVDMSVL